MKVLMYGWEFPPHISGGLGIACYAIVTELAKKNIAVTMVLPHQPEEAIQDRNISLLSCCDATDQNGKQVSCCSTEVIDKAYDELTVTLDSSTEIARVQMFTSLRPYLSPSKWQKIDRKKFENFLAFLEKMSLAEELKRFAREILSRVSGSGDGDAFYGFDLLNEVFCYALLAGSMASRIPHDIIHVHDWLTVLAGVEAKSRSRKPLVFHVHSLETDRSGMSADYRIKSIEKFGMEQADQVVAVSQYTKNEIVKHYNIAADKIAVVHNGAYAITNRKKNELPDRPKMVLFLGRVTQQKGPYYFIEVARRILEKRKDVQFVVAGTGDLLADMIHRVAELKIGKHVHFTGFLKRSEVDEIFHRADVYVMPSVSEPFGLACIEALSRHVPVVLSKQSGVSEVMTHTLLADFWDTEKMSEQILALLRYPILRKTSLSNSTLELRDISWPKAIDKIVSIYSRLTME